MSPPLTQENYQTHIKKNEISRNRHLAYVMKTAATEDAPTWATNFVESLQTGQIKSLTKAKDTASILWRDHSNLYDKSRAVQVPTENSGDGHTVQRKRHIHETQYEYRKRKAIEQRETDTQDTSNNTRISNALRQKDRCLEVLKMTKEQLKTEMINQSEVINIMRQHTDMDKKTIDQMRITLLSAAAYERF
ncbi:unnamed protein product [Mytilus coruscus]|uniref:Uncharacterized protein n=1 Tax=Mytilus coruscus TaxID=42192 RepID=A0A6J8C8Y2_MYTCO|nr:unnamed protein product [Mytilus coruscus]